MPPRLPALLALLLLACQPVPGDCDDPVDVLAGSGSLKTLSILRETCPACPRIEQAAYADAADYVTCVDEITGVLLASGDLDAGQATALHDAAAASGIGAAAPATRLIPGPGENGYDAWLADLAEEYDRQFFTFHAAPFAMSLDVHVDLAAAAERDAIETFLGDPAVQDDPLAFGPDAFLAHSGLAVFDVVDHYAEVGDLGMFGGVAAAGDFFRYAVLRDLCAAQALGCELLPDARARLLEILEVLHVAHRITGEHGVIVRGLFRRGMPRRGGDPETIPLADAAGNPNPPCSEKPENPTFAGFSQRLRFREDATQTLPGDPATGLFPDWIWMDNASKDQLTGWIYAIGAAWDVIHDDAGFADDVKTRLADDAASIARKLRRVGGPQTVDLTIFDGDGCVTTFHDLHPAEVEGAGVALLTSLLLNAPGPAIEGQLRHAIARLQNAFNGLLALASFRTLCHVSGAADVCAFYYDELVDRRQWHRLLLQMPVPLEDLPPAAVGVLLGLGFPDDIVALHSLAIDFRHETNYSNVNMAFLGFYGLLRYEPDPVLRSLYGRALERSLWDTGLHERQPKRLRQTFFDLLYAGLRSEGTDTRAVPDGVATLHSFPPPPYWNLLRENCSDGETALGAACEAEDGSFLRIAPRLGRGGALVSRAPVPKRTRPPSNYEWRSNPYAVNGGGGDRLNPGGDFRGAYWLGRFLHRGDGLANLAPDSVPRD